MKEVEEIAKDLTINSLEYEVAKLQEAFLLMDYAIMILCEAMQLAPSTVESVVRTGTAIPLVKEATEIYKKSLKEQKGNTNESLTKQAKDSIELCCPDKNYPDEQTKCPQCRDKLRIIYLSKAYRYQCAAGRLLKFYIDGTVPFRRITTVREPAILMRLATIYIEAKEYYKRATQL